MYTSSEADRSLSAKEDIAGAVSLASETRLTLKLFFVRISVGIKRMKNKDATRIIALLR